MIKGMKRAICLVLLVCVLSGCAAPVVKIGYTVYPIEYIVKEIAGDKAMLYPMGDNTQILRSQASVDFEENLDQIDVLIHIGDLEPYLDVYDKDIKESRVETLDLSTRTSIYEFKRYTSVMVSGTESVVESKYYDGAAFDAVDTYTIDPYLWIDPIAMTSMANQIKEWLIEKMPEEKAYFEENYAALEMELVRLGAEYQLLKDSGRDIKLVTMTPSFGNWQKYYGVEVYPVILSEYGVLPTFEQYELIKQRIVEDGVKYIVEEPNMPQDIQDLYNRLKEELQLETIKLNSLTYLSDDLRMSGKDYIQVMYENLAELENIPVEIVVPIN